jgi:hypothetical protein
LHRWFIPAIRPGSAIDSTHITFSEVFSIFFMQQWGKDSNFVMLDLIRHPVFAWIALRITAYPVSAGMTPIAVAAVGLGRQADFRND